MQKLAAAKTVLHLGCTGSPSTEVRIQRGESMHMNLLKAARTVHGIDLDAAALKTLREKYGVKNLFEGNVERLGEVRLDGQETFDLIVAAEIIEHLSRPGDMLEGVKRFMRPDSRLLITTPNPLSLKYFVHALRGREVQGPDHTVLISPQTAIKTFPQNRFRAT